MTLHHDILQHLSTKRFKVLYEELLLTDEPKIDHNGRVGGLVEFVDSSFISTWLVLYPDQPMPSREIRDTLRNDTFWLMLSRLLSPEAYLRTLRLAESNGKRIQTNRGPKEDDVDPLGDNWQTLEEPVQWLPHPYLHRVHPEDLIGATAEADVEV